MGTRSRIAMQPARLDAARAIGQYDRLAPVYGLWTGLFESRATGRALELADVHEGEHVLEVAIGTGGALRALVAKGAARTVGLDASSAMVKRARRRTHGAAELLLGDCRSLPLADETFDLVFDAYLLDLLSEADMRKTLVEFHRVLRPGGRLVQVSMTQDGPLIRLWDWIYARWPSLLGGCRSVETATLVEGAGFRDLRRELVRQMGFPSEVVVARR